MKEGGWARGRSESRRRSDGGGGVEGVQLAGRWERRPIWSPAADAAAAVAHPEERGGNDFKQRS